MMSALSSFVRPFLLKLDPEVAHELTLRALELGAFPRCSALRARALEVDLWGEKFPNPLGIAAGFDKDARVPDAILDLGFGFAEIGTTTPLPQPGNPAPRVFRLASHCAVINRLGFNNQGHAAALRRLEERLSRAGESKAGESKAGARKDIVGVNIGANKESPDRAADYVTGIETFYDVASYFTVNISSPNTPGLRDLQAPAALAELMERVMAARAAKVASGSPRRPIVVKIAPDIADDDIEPMVAALAAHGVDGIAVSNTTLARDKLTDPAAKETGGLSGRPLFNRSTVVLARVYQATGGKIPLIGIGGIDSPERALAKIEAGATLLQLYTGLIYEGPGLVGRINGYLAKVCADRGLTSITQLTGTRAAEWAVKPLA